MELIENILEKFTIKLHAYCLMTNHYHLLIETTDENISKAIQYLNGSYSIYYNKKYRRTGHFWQGRYLSYYLYDDIHAWIVVKYIERNPITAKMVKNIDDYPYQSFYQWKTKDKYFKLLHDSLILDMTLEEYERYIYHEMKEEEFIQIYTTPKIVTKDGKMRVLSKRLETFFEEDRDINRNENIKKAWEYGYSKVEIARFVGLSVRMIRKIL